VDPKKTQYISMRFLRLHEDLLSSCLISQNVDITMHKAITLPTDCMCVKPGLSQLKVNTKSECSTTGCWGKCLDL